MSWQRWALAVVVIVFAATQYALMAYSMNDLRMRRRARGENKMAWTLAVIAIPIFGPLLYARFGPTDFLNRKRAPDPENLVLDSEDLRDAP